MMSRLAHTRDGILVSLETITDYQLKPGSLLRLRVLDQRTGHFRRVPFHVVPGPVLRMQQDAGAA